MSEKKTTSKKVHTLTLEDQTKLAQANVKKMEQGKIEVMKVVEGVQGAEKLAELIERGKKNGKLSSSELMDVLENLDLESDQMDKIYDTLENLGIDTVGDDYLPELADDIMPPLEELNEIEELPEEEMVDPNTLVDSFGIDDPVRMYLKEIGKVNLLTPDEEVQLAQDMGAGDAAKEQMEEIGKARENGEEVSLTPEEEAALKKAAIEYPETPFVFIDGYPLTDDAGNTLSNVAGIAFKEEQAGYLAGYAAVMDGFTKLGFSGGGGGTNPACCRFGYGYVQGANAAALEKGVTVDMNYSWQYGSNFSASTDLQTMINGWYVNGTEIVFACGGSMFQSIVAAASANDGYVIGVDVDQSGESEYVVTSAMKGLADAVQWAVAKVYDGTFDTIGGQQTSLGVADNAVQLPTGADSWRFETFTVEEYESLYQQMVDGTLVVDDDYTVMDNAETATNWSNVNVNII